MSETDRIGSAAGDALVGRAGAFLLDFLLMGVAAFVVWLVVTGAQLLVIQALGGNVGDEAGLLVAGVFQFLKWGGLTAVVFAYFAYTTLRDGQTLGKRLADVVVISADGSPVGLRGAVVRTAVLLVPLAVVSVVGMVVSAWVLLLGAVIVPGWLLLEAVVMGVTAEHTRIGDFVAGTRVVPAEAAERLSVEGDDEHSPGGHTPEGSVGASTDGDA